MQGFMQRAAELAAISAAEGEVPVGAVVVTKQKCTQPCGNRGNKQCLPHSRRLAALAVRIVRHS